MDPFEAWVQTAQSASVQKYKDELLTLGANFDSFKREVSEVVDDLVSGGIPRMAARDVYKAVAETIAKRSVPMAVFWDVENVPVPSACTGRYVASRLKSSLADYGDLVEFRGYASIGLNNIPEEKRSDLQLSGCHLVDCPHNGRKEVADKMIIVDAMDFVIDRPDGAVLCFITGDTDYAYLLAKLQKRKNCCTIVISRGTAESMLHVSCDVKLQWETDVLRLNGVPAKPAASSVVEAPPGFPAQVEHEPAQSKLEPNTTPKSYASAAAPVPGATAPPSFTDRSTSASLCPLPYDPKQAFNIENAKEMIRSAMFCATEGSKVRNVCLKSFVCNILRKHCPSRFPTQEAVNEFLSFAIERGIVVESEEREEHKWLKLPDISRSSPIFESTLPLVPVELMPTRALVVLASRPFVIFISWTECPKTSELPKWTFVQQYEYMAILIYASRDAALSAVEACPQLSRGALVDWRKVTSTGVELANRSGPCLTSPLSTNMQLLEEGESSTKGQQRVCDLLELFAANDDIYVIEEILQTLLNRKHPEECPSKKHASLWITTAINVGLVKRIPVGKGTSVCLASNYRAAVRPFPPLYLDTTSEEAYVVDLLRGSPDAWLARTVVGKKLAMRFDRMSTAYMRNKVFMNAHKKNRIFVSKSEYGHTVALTERDARFALRFLKPASMVDTPFGSVSNAHVAGSANETPSTSSDDNSSLSY